MTLVDFWSSLCVNCAREALKVEHIYERYKGAGLAAVGAHSPQQVHEREAPVASDATFRLDATYPAAPDLELEAPKAHGTNTWPIYYLAGPGGQLHPMDRGTPGLEEQIHTLPTGAGASLPNWGITL